MSKYYTTTYIDPQGRVKTGYSKDGLTYKDPGYTQRIDPGTVVSTLGGTYVMTDNGGVKLSDYNKSARAGTQSYIDSARQSAVAAQKLRTDSAVAELEGSRSGINQSYDDIAREAYAAFRTGESGLANRLAGSGLYNSGYSDTLRSAGLTSYREDLNRSERERASALTALEGEIAKTKAEGGAKLGEIESRYAEMGLDQYNTDRNYDYKQSRDSVADSRYADETAYSREREKEAEAMNKALEAAKYGDYSGLGKLGIDTAAYQAERAARRRTEEEERSWSRALEALSAGDPSLLAKLGVDTSGYERKQQWTEALNAFKAGDTSGLRALGVDTSAYDEKTAQALASEAYAGGSGLSALQKEQAVSMAQKFVSNNLEQGRDYDFITDVMRRLEKDGVRLYGQEFWDVYVDAALSLIPGSSTYKPAEAEGGAAFTVKEYYNLLTSALNGGASGSDVIAVIEESGLSAQEKKELINLLGI